MADLALKQRLQDERKQALKAQDKDKLRAVGLVMAAIKQEEVDTQKELDENALLSLLDKMLKQRYDSISQYQEAGRQDLVAQEEFEVAVIKSYLPEPMNEQELTDLIQATIRQEGAQGVRDMGKVINVLRPQLVGLADMRIVSEKVKSLLS